MEKEELRLGNWVKHPELEYYNDPEDFCDGFAKITQLGICDLSTTSLKEVAYSEISGIELTDQILSRLGFKKDGYTNLSPDYYFESDEAIICINLKPTCDRYGGFRIENKRRRLSVCLEIPNTAFGEDRILYVHQLQNMLDLCKINFSIEL